MSELLTKDSPKYKRILRNTGILILSEPIEGEDRYFINPRELVIYELLIFKAYEYDQYDPYVHTLLKRNGLMNKGDALTILYEDVYNENIGLLYEKLEDGSAGLDYSQLLEI